jgi:transposase-like protein
MRKYRVYSQEFKEAVSRRLVKGESVSAVHDELQIGLSVLYRWRDAYRKEGAAGLRPTGGVPLPPRPWEQRIAELERKIGQQAAGYGFLDKSLQACKGVTPEEHRHWKDSIYGEIRSMMQREGLAEAALR